MSALRRIVVGVGVLVLMLTGACTIKADPASNPANKVSRPLTVGTFGRLSTTDPAAAADNGATVFTLNVFQRLMSVEVGTGALKPDAASDCWYIDDRTYSCGIKRNLTFTNGNELTASDVKFSLDRARRLNVPGTSARLLDSIEDIVIPDNDPLRVDIRLRQHDRDFGYALASPAASIVDEKVFKSDRLWPNWQPPPSSGPFFADAVNLDELQLGRYPRYWGAHPTALPAVTIKTFTTGGALDRAIATKTIDVLWRVPEDVVPGAYLPHTLPGATVQRLVWNPNSPKRNDAALREWVRDATAPIRTMPSGIPRGVAFAADTFGVGGGRPQREMRGELTLGYDVQLPGQAQLAAQVQSALQPQVSVQLLPDGRDADVWLSSNKAWTNTTLAWLQPYVEFPLPDRVEAVRRAELEYRRSGTLPEAERTARGVQELMTADATVVPLTQSDEVFWMAPGVTLVDEKELHLGPCWQLGVWGFKRA